MADIKQFVSNLQDFLEYKKEDEFQTLGVPPETLAAMKPAAAPKPAPQQTAALYLIFGVLLAAGLTLNHPISGKPMTFEVPLPADMETLLAQLRALSHPA